MYDVAVEIILSPLKFLTVALFLTLFFIIVFSSLGEKQFIDADRAETRMAMGQILTCVMKDSKINKDFLGYDYLHGCLNAKNYGIKIIHDEDEIIVNNDIYSSYSGFCNRLSVCESFLFKDLNNDEIKMQVVFKKTERK